MTPFRYLPLPPVAETGTTPPFTRILYLFPGAGEDPFNGALETVDVERCLPYEAVSYTWGREDASDYLWIGGVPLPIRHNLAAVLRSLRLPTQARRLWIDAVCINQADPDERSRQVRYMRLVYKHAARVIVWLGTKSPGVEAAFRAAERIARMREMTHPSAAGGPVDREATAELMLSMMTDLPPGAMASLSELLARPYFSRCWCVQEVVAASWAVARVEELEMSFFDILASVIFVNNWKGEMRVDTPLALWGFVSARREASPPFEAGKVDGSVGSFLQLLGLTRNMSASDDRDKIFSLLGICDEGLQPVLATTQVMGPANNGLLLRTLRRGVTRLSELVNSLGPDQHFGRPRALRPDYTRDTASVYADLTRFLVRKSPRMLDVLDHVQHNGEPGEEDGSGAAFPSWVPRWFEPNSVFVFSGAFLAGLCDGHFRYFAELHDCPLHGDAARPMVLSLDGYQFDVAQVTSEVMSFGSGEEEALEAVGRVWSQLFPHPLFPRAGTRYFDGRPLDVAFCRALLVSQLGALMGSMVMNSAPSLGLHVDLGDMESSTMEKTEKMADDMVDAFLSRASSGTSGRAAGEPSRLFTGYITGARWYSSGRRAFRTHGGRVGIGPKAMRPGDELVSLFGGRMPFVLRRRADHHVFVGSCYVVDEELMWGKVTEKVRFGRGGPPVRTFELW